MFKKRKLQIILEHNLRSGLDKAVMGHGYRSAFFKPEVSIILPENFVPSEIRMFLRDLANTTGEDQYVDLFVVSDGNKAYVKKV